MTCGLPIEVLCLATLSYYTWEHIEYTSSVKHLELSDGSAFSTVGQAANAIYFTLEQFVARLHFPVLSLVKQFLHITRAPPALIHPNVFRILMGCSVLNFLYQLDNFSSKDIFRLYVEAGDRGPTIYVDPQSLATICNQAP